VNNFTVTEVHPAIKKSLAQEFFDFLKKFGIIGLAIAFVIGQAAS
jgi:large conductance mechanosensitive channel